MTDLTDKQRRIAAVIEAYWRATGEGCSQTYVARQVGITRESLRGHLAALFRKGRLRSPTSPLIPADTPAQR